MKVHKPSISHSDVPLVRLALKITKLKDIEKLLRILRKPLSHTNEGRMILNNKNLTMEHIKKLREISMTKVRH